MHRRLALLGQVDRLLHQAHHRLALLTELNGDEPEFGISNRRVQRLLIDVLVHLTSTRLVPRRRVPLLDHAFQLLLVLHAFEPLLILHTRV